MDRSASGWSRRPCSACSPLPRSRLCSTCPSGGLCGRAGVFAGLVQSSFDPNFGFQLLLPVFAAVVLGGIGSAYGALAGGLVLGLAMELSTWTSLLGGVNPVYKPVVAFGILIVALMVRPQGLFGRARVV